MSLYTSLRPLLFTLPPERAHQLAMMALFSGILPARAMPSSARLTTNVCGLEFPHPIGLAAGCDKNAQAIDGFAAQGFGFVECGTVTPLAQDGNPKPRVFRLPKERAIINRLGFNNDGLDVFIDNLRVRKSSAIVGGNIGKNKNAVDAVADYVTCLNALYPYVDYITVNISSPNTVGLRDLQVHDALTQLVRAVHVARDTLIAAGEKRKPIWIKIAPDLTPDDVAMIAEIALAKSLDGLIVSNTTISRPNMAQVPDHLAQGGLSGAPLMTQSTQILADMARATQGKVALIGVGGVGNAEDAYQKILHGASLVQLYTALIYQGFGLAADIAHGLDTLLARDGFANVKDAVGKAL